MAGRRDHIGLVVGKDHGAGALRDVDDGVAGRFLLSGYIEANFVTADRNLGGGHILRLLPHEIGAELLTEGGNGKQQKRSGQLKREFTGHNTLLKNCQGWKAAKFGAWQASE